jgi:CRISPR/Cas system-associated protein Csm6
MTKETKELVLKELNRLRGDDYERAKAAFRNRTPKQMQEIYGASGKTCQALLNECREYAEKVERAIAEIEKM